MNCKEKYDEAMNYLEKLDKNSDSKSNIEYKFYTIKKEKFYDIKISEEVLTNLQREIYKKYN